MIKQMPSQKPNAYQQEQINRKYGMFIHFGMNTFLDLEWSDGTSNAKIYNPSEIDCEQWVKTAIAMFPCFGFIMTSIMKNLHLQKSIISLNLISFLLSKTIC